MTDGARRIEVFLPKRTFPVKPQAPEYFEYAYTDEGQLPSSELLDRLQVEGTTENHLRLIAQKVISRPWAGVSVDYAITSPEDTANITYITKSVPPQAELLAGHQWVPFKYLPDAAQVSLLALKRRIVL